MKRWLFILISLLVLNGCVYNYSTPTSALDFVPYDTDILIKVSAESDYEVFLETDHVLSNLDVSIKSSLISSLNLFNPEGTVYAAIQTTKDDTYHLLITDYETTPLSSNDSIPLMVKDNSETQTIKDKIDKQLYYKVMNNFFVASNKKIVIDTLNISNASSELVNLMNVSNSDADIAIGLTHQPAIQNPIFFNAFQEISFSENTILDTQSTSNGRIYSGITRTVDSGYFVNSFKNTIPQPLHIDNILPSQTSFFKRMAFDDSNVFLENLSTIKDSENANKEIFLSLINEVAEFTFKTETGLVIHALDEELLSQSITADEILENFKDINIYAFNNSAIFKQQFEPLISFNRANFYFILENFIVFGESVDLLKSIITEKRNENTLKKSEPFQDAVQDLAHTSSLLIFMNDTSFKTVNAQHAYNTNLLQLSYEQNFAHVDVVFKNYKAPKRRHTISEHLSIELPNDLIMTPQVVKNHVKNTYDIITQDVNNTLYLISNTGQIKWTRQLDTKVLGKIEQIDTYKNNKLQLAFATTNNVYVIDRNGKDVGKFPLNFNDPITQPLSVFDYDKKKNYRLLVTQNNTLLMYDKLGKRVNGFKFGTASNSIRTQPKHLRISRKDYIVFAQGNQLEILSRTGKTRIAVSEKIRFSENEIYLYQNNFTTTNTLGELIQISTSGRVKSKPLNLPEDHSIDATSKTLVSLHDNKLSIRDRIVDLDYGTYTKPKIFYLNDKIYISVTELESNKVFLYDSQATSIPNFPIYGTSAAILKNIDKDQSLELITQGDSKSITVYKLN